MIRARKTEILTLHVVSVVVVQMVLTPVVHVEPAAHVLHGVYPKLEKVVPAAHICEACEER